MLWPAVKAERRMLACSHLVKQRQERHLVLSISYGISWLGQGPAP